jgi:hypothetical protein
LPVISPEQRPLPRSPPGDHRRRRNAANKDGAVGTASMRTIGTGAQQAMPGNRTLDGVNAPTGPVNMNSQRIVSLLDPSGAQDAATKSYVDNVAQDSTPNRRSGLRPPRTWRRCPGLRQSTGCP